MGASLQNSDPTPYSIMHGELINALSTIRQDRAFDAKKWIDQKTDMFNKYMTDCGLSGCCVSLSGGVDSAVTFALMLAASRKAGSPIKRVVAIAQPIKSTKSIQNRAFEAAEKLGGEIITVDQTELHTQL